MPLLDMFIQYFISSMKEGKRDNAHIMENYTMQENILHFPVYIAVCIVSAVSLGTEEAYASTQ